LIRGNEAGDKADGILNYLKRHPDGYGWVMKWHPLIREIIIYPSRLPYGQQANFHRIAF
jgi:hypothetical protein